MSTDLVLLSRVAFRGRDITGPRLHALLALLADDLRTGSSAARLIGGLWPDQRPENPAKALQVLVSRIRAQVGPDVIASTPAGYRLALSQDQVDSSAVPARAVAAARFAQVGDQLAALAEADAGLALWAGPADGVAEAGDPLSELRAGRVPAYRSLRRIRALTLARLGRHLEALEPLAEQVAESSRDEELLAELLRAEAATAGPAVALARYEEYRRSLRDELGTDPGEPLRAVYQQLLRDDAPAVRYGVPHDPNPLLGREHDIDAVANLLGSSRVTSIVGPGGLGKTRLAYAVSRRPEHRVVHVVPLAGVGADEEVAGAVAAAVETGERGRVGAAQPGGAAAAIATVLGAGPVLLVLDNCEQVVDGVAELVGALVALTQDLRVLTTSRTPLGLSSESVYLLPELDLDTAAELFAERARAARPGAELPADQVTELCRQLDGLPLAIELAAARVRTMSVAEITRRLRDRFGLLRGGPRDAPQRHRTLYAVVDWSWNLLEPPAQAALRALSVFAGGFGLVGAGALLGAGDPDTLDIVEELVGQSLLKVSDSPAGVRLRMLETVREFSAARREEAGETGTVQARFLAWARGFGADHQHTFADVDPFGTLEAVRIEQDNLLLAMRLGYTDHPAVAGDEDHGATVAVTAAVLAGLWSIESNFARLNMLVGEPAWVLSHYRPAPQYVEATRTAAALITMATFLLQGPRAIRSLLILRRLPPASPDTLVRALAVLLADRDALGPDQTRLRELCASDEPLLAGVANSAAGYVLESLNDPDGAIATARATLAAFERHGGAWLRSVAHSRLAELLSLYVEEGDEARQHLGAALGLMAGQRGLPEQSSLRWAMVLASLQVGAFDDAEHWLAQASADPVDDSRDTELFGELVQAGLLIARDQVDAGLARWRQVADQVIGSAVTLPGIDPALDPWRLEITAVTVVEHSRHGRVELVEPLVTGLASQLVTVLGRPFETPPPTFLDEPTCGTLLVALAVADLDTGDRQARRTAVRMIALAERFRFLRRFRPAMTSVRIRGLALDADEPAYDEAVSSYAGLDSDGLRSAAAELLDQRAGSRL